MPGFPAAQSRLHPGLCSLPVFRHWGTQPPAAAPAGWRSKAEVRRDQSPAGEVAEPSRTGKCPRAGPGRRARVLRLATSRCATTRGPGPAFVLAACIRSTKSWLVVSESSHVNHVLRPPDHCPSAWKGAQLRAPPRRRSRRTSTASVVLAVHAVIGKRGLVLMGGCDRQPERRPAWSWTCGSSPTRSPVLRRREHECDRASRGSEPLQAGQSASRGPLRRTPPLREMRLRRVIDARGPVTLQAVTAAAWPPPHGKEHRAPGADPRPREPQVRRPRRSMRDCSTESAHGEERLRSIPPFLRSGLRPHPIYSSARRNMRRRSSGSSHRGWD